MLEIVELRRWIESGINCQHLEIEGDGHHFQAFIVSEEFTGLSRIARQQKVNALLAPHFDSGQLHALSMKTVSPAEWNFSSG